MEEGEMEAGRELDALVDKRVMGNTVSQPLRIVPYYSTDRAAVWDVVDEVEDRDENLSLCLLKTISGEWQASFVFGGIDTASAPTFPHAICLAAIRALEEPTP